MPCLQSKGVGEVEDKRICQSSEEDETTEQTEQICSLDKTKKFEIVFELVQFHTSETVD